METKTESYFRTLAYLNFENPAEIGEWFLEDAQVIVTAYYAIHSGVEVMVEIQEDDWSGLEVYSKPWRADDTEYKLVTEKYKPQGA